MNVSVVSAGLPNGCIGYSGQGAHSVPAGEPALGVQEDRLSPQASGTALQEAHTITPIPGALQGQALLMPVLYSMSRPRVGRDHISLCSAFAVTDKYCFYSP